MKHTRMTSLTSFLSGCFLLRLFRPMLPSVGGFTISSDDYILNVDGRRIDDGCLAIPHAHL